MDIIGAAACKDKGNDDNVFPPLFTDRKTLSFWDRDFVDFTKFSQEMFQ
jgi:hypothetical protein